MEKDQLANAIQSTIESIKANMEYYHETRSEPVTREQVDKILLAALTNLRDYLYA